MLGSADCCLSFRFVVDPRVLRSVLHGPDCSQAKQIVGGRDQRKVHDLRQWRQGTDLREKPDVSIEKQFQSRSVSISFSSMTGDTMSPMMSIVSFMKPIQLFCPASGEGGTISATGLPKRMTRVGFSLAHRFEQRKALGLNSEGIGRMLAGYRSAR